MPKMLERLTICATGSRRSTGRNALHIRTVPQKLIANSHSRSARLTSSKRPSSATPALLIRRFALPCSASTTSRKDSAAAGSPTSAACSLTATAVLRAADATRARASRSRSISAKPQPRDARRSASAAPMPFAAPVKTATPSRSGNVIGRFPSYALTKTSKLATPTSRPSVPHSRAGVASAMRILQIHSGINLNGAVRYAVLVSRLLALRGHEIVMLHRPVRHLGAVLALPDHIDVQMSSLQRRPAEIRRVARLCRDKRIDVIHTHKSSAHAFGALLRLFYGVPCVATAHSLNYQLHWMVNDRVVCHNAESMRFMHRRNFVPWRKLRQVPAFVDEFYLGAAAEERARTLGGEDRVIWLEGTSDRDIGHLLRAADLYVQASLVETGPLVVLEAMALGLPVVGTICGSMPDFILPGVTGELVPPGEPRALGEALVRVLADPERARAMGREGRRRFAAQFSAEVNIPKLEAILAEAAGGPGAGHQHPRR